MFISFRVNMAMSQMCFLMALTGNQGGNGFEYGCCQLEVDAGGSTAAGRKASPTRRDVDRNDDCVLGIIAVIAGVSFFLLLTSGAGQRAAIIGIGLRCQLSDLRDEPRGAS